MSSASLLLQFGLCAALIARAGFVLSHSADQLAEAHGRGRGWILLALLATVTSLPELASGISAMTLADAPNLAVGNELGAAWLTWHSWSRLMRCNGASRCSSFSWRDAALLDQGDRNLGQVNHLGRR